MRDDNNEPFFYDSQKEAEEDVKTKTTSFIPLMIHRGKKNYFYCNGIISLIR